MTMVYVVYVLFNVCLRVFQARIHTQYVFVYTHMYVRIRNGIRAYTCCKSCICTFKMSVYMFVYDNRLFCIRDIDCLYTRSQTRIRTLLFDVDKQRQIYIRDLRNCVDTLFNNRIQNYRLFVYDNGICCIRTVQCLSTCFSGAYTHSVCVCIHAHVCTYTQRHTRVYVLQIVYMYIQNVRVYVCIR